MDTFLFGDPRLFVMGAELTMTDRATGNIVAYDNVGTDAAVNYTFDLSEITGGIQNQLVGLIPHSTRLTGSYTSNAFSLAQRALLTGGSLVSNGISPVCELITASGTTLTVTKTPAKALSQPADDTYAWCYVCPHGASTFEGANYGVDISTKQVQNFTATANAQYDVYYFSALASSKQLGLSAAADPSLVSVQLKWAVYADQNGNRAHGTLQGYLYVIVPVALPNGDAGVSGSNTSNATTQYTWRAIDADNNMPKCDDCDGTANNIGYYVYVPCGTEYQNVSDIVVVGGDMTIAVGSDTQLNIRLIMKDGSTVTPDYSDLTYNSATSGVATINAGGVVHPVAQGTSVITATLNTGSKTITAKTTVTVVTG